MELRELIAKIKNFNNTIISLDDYTNPNSDNYLFGSESILYENELIKYKKEVEKEAIAFSTFRNQIDQELNIIDIELIELKISKPFEYDTICTELIPELIATLDNLYSKYYPFGWGNIEKHLNNPTNSIKHKTEINPPSEIEILKQKDKVRLIYELGIIKHLENEYPYIKGNAQRITHLLMQFLDIQESSLQPIVNALNTENTSNKNYPQLTQLVKSVINKYTLEK